MFFSKNLFFWFQKKKIFLGQKIQFFLIFFLRKKLILGQIKFAILVLEKNSFFFLSQKILFFRNTDFQKKNLLLWDKNGFFSQIFVLEILFFLFFRKNQSIFGQKKFKNMGFRNFFFWHKWIFQKNWILKTKFLVFGKHFFLFLCNFFYEQRKLVNPKFYNGIHITFRCIFKYVQRASEELIQNTVLPKRYEDSMKYTRGQLIRNMIF